MVTNHGVPAYITEAEVKASNISDILSARYSIDMNNELSSPRAQPPPAKQNA